MFNLQDYSNKPVYFGQEPAFSFANRKGRRPSTGNPGTVSTSNWYKKDEQDPKIAAMQQQQQTYQQQLQATANASAAANTKQLQILQGEKSAISKMTQEYTAMLQEEADRKVKAQEEARVSAATSAANQSRQGQTANLQIQPASSTPQTAGTQPFKRRKDQFKITKPAYSGLSISQSGMVNV